MQANEFVKLRGISYCKELLIKADGCVAIQARENSSRVSVDDLKHLVESWELVESYGGLDACYEKLYKLHELTESPDPIRDAIADVESCL